MVSWNSVYHKTRRIAELDPHERWLLLQAVVLLALVGIIRRFASFRCLQALLARALPQAKQRLHPDRTERDVAQRTARAVQIAAHHGLLRANCLERSLTLWSLLRRQGINADLRIGVRTAGDQFEAHAWIEYQGVVLNDTPDITERFAGFREPLGSVSR
jgi:hypothetical protein